MDIHLELTLGRPRIPSSPCLCVRHERNRTLGILDPHVQGPISRLILLLMLCACWALADHPTASLFIIPVYSPQSFVPLLV